MVLQAGTFGVEAQPLSHTVPAIGYRLVEPDGRRMLPDTLAALGLTGPDIGRCSARAACSPATAW